MSAQRLAGESAGPEAAHLLPSAGEQVSGQTGDRPAIRGWTAARQGPWADPMRSSVCESLAKED